MTNTRSHAPIRDVLFAAGLRGSDGGESTLTPEEEDAVMEEHRRSFARLRAKKRYAGEDAYEPELGYAGAEESESWSSSLDKDADEIDTIKRAQTLSRRSDKSAGSGQGRERQPQQQQQHVSKRRPQPQPQQPERRQRPRRTLKHVANPDDSQHDLHELEHEHNGYGHAQRPHEWSLDTPALPYLDGFGRREAHEGNRGGVTYPPKTYRQDRT